MRDRGVRRGFLYIDMLVAMTIIVMMAMLVVPGLRDDAHVRVVAAAEILTSDIELAQLMSIAGPDDPVAVVFDSDGYTLAHKSNFAAAIERPTDANGFGGQPYSIEFGKGRASHAADVTATIDTATDMLIFNGLGALDEPMPVTIRLSYKTRWLDVEVSPTTGTITQTAGGG